jgi:hypothetical protein
MRFYRLLKTPIPYGRFRAVKANRNQLEMQGSIGVR